MTTEANESQSDDINDNKAGVDDSTKHAENDNKKAEAKSDNSKPENNIFDDEESVEFNKEYFSRLREENKKTRLKVKELERRLQEKEPPKQAEPADDLTKKSLDKVTKLHNAFEKRIINAELQQLAAKEGLIDIDAFKMVDLSSVKLSDDGEVIGLAKIMDELKTKKPYLFKLSSNANKNANEPPADTKTNKKVTYQTVAEYKKAKQAFLNSLR